MRHQGHGHLVLVSSCFVAGLPVTGMGYYLAAKAALQTLFYSVAVEAAPSGVRVSCFQPGPVMTELERVWATARRWAVTLGQTSATSYTRGWPNLGPRHRSRTKLRRRWPTSSPPMIRRRPCSRDRHRGHMQPVPCGIRAVTPNSAYCSPESLPAHADQRRDQHAQHQPHRHRAPGARHETGTFTQMGVAVVDIVATVAELHRCGVVFEEVDLPA